VFKVLPLLKIGAILDGPDPKGEIRKSLAIVIGNLERNFSWHDALFSKRSLMAVRPSGNQ
jgi:hypothetical protein